MEMAAINAEIDLGDGLGRRACELRVHTAVLQVMHKPTPLVPFSEGCRYLSITRKKALAKIRRGELTVITQGKDRYFLAEQLPGYQKI